MTLFLEELIIFYKVFIYDFIVIFLKASIIVQCCLKVSVLELSSQSITAQCPKYRTFGHNFYFNLRRDSQKNSYGRRAYESVDERAYLKLFHEKQGKK